MLKNSKWYKIIVFLIISLMELVAMEASITIHFFDVNAKYLLCGYCAILLFNVMITLIIGYPSISLSILSVLISVISIVNYYTYIYHGSPLTLMELKNFATATEVMGSYTFAIGKTVIAIVVLCAIEIVLVIISFGKSRVKRGKLLTTAIILSILVFFEYCSGFVVPKYVHFWNWSPVLEKYGYTCSVVRYSIDTVNFVKKPEVFLESEVVAQCENYTVEERSDARPDIIFILNETFYDMSQIRDMTTDIDYRSGTRALDGAIHGYAINPVIGGSTNASEYEYLTSNSMLMMPGITPFNTLDLTDANSAVTYAKSLGYTTLATHPATSTNYNRQASYSKLGFDQIHFIEDFTDIKWYGKREYATDESLYNNALNWYNQMGEGSRFMYILTIQNHANYELNDSSEDIVHVLDNGVEDNSILNEYLSCVYLSDQAFVKLTEQFKDIDRDVIICMVGDHCPGFARDLVEEKYSEDSDLRLRSVPFIIWSNNEELLQNYNVGNEKISMAYLVPTVFETAGVNLSGYYDYMVKLRSESPIIDNSEFFDDYRKYEYLNIKYPNDAKNFYLAN